MLEAEIKAQHRFKKDDGKLHALVITICFTYVKIKLGIMVVEKV